MLAERNFAQGRLSGALEETAAEPNRARAAKIRPARTPFAAVSSDRARMRCRNIRLRKASRARHRICGGTSTDENRSLSRRRVRPGQTMAPGAIRRGRRKDQRAIIDAMDFVRNEDGRGNR